jgi:hypothetical protein
MYTYRLPSSSTAPREALRIESLDLADANVALVVLEEDERYVKLLVATEGSYCLFREGDEDCPV